MEYHKEYYESKVSDLWEDHSDKVCWEFIEEQDLIMEIYNYAEKVNWNEEKVEEYFISLEEKEQVEIAKLYMDWDNNLELSEEDRKADLFCVNCNQDKISYCQTTHLIYRMNQKKFGKNLK